MTLTPEQKDLLLGTLLGDGNLQTATKGRTWRYRALHSDAQKEYLFHKYEILKPLCNHEPVYEEIFDDRTQKNSERWYFNTLVHPSLRHFGNIFYTYDPKTDRMVKDVPTNIEKFLSARAVAYWYMDDGSLKWRNKSNAMRICTESFSRDGVIRLQTAFRNLYNIETQLTVANAGFRLAINEKNSTPFRELIKPFLVDCMRFKVSDGHKSTL